MFLRGEKLPPPQSFFTAREAFAEERRLREVIAKKTQQAKNLLIEIASLNKQAEKASDQGALLSEREEWRRSIILENIANKYRGRVGFERRVQGLDTAAKRARRLAEQRSRWNIDSGLC